MTCTHTKKILAAATLGLVALAITACGTHANFVPGTSGLAETHRIDATPAHPVSVVNTECEYFTRLYQNGKIVSVFARITEKSIAAGFEIPASSLPLKEGFDEILNSPLEYRRITYKNGVLKLFFQSQTDFGERRWAEIKIDANLLTPTEMVLKSGLFVDIPLSTGKCVLPR